MSATLQTDFELRRLGKPQMCVKRDGAQQMLGVDHAGLEAILNRPLNHKLRLTGVLDIASRDASHQHLHFVVVCLREFDAGVMVKRTDAQMTELIFGPEQKLMFGVRVRRALNCTHDHFYALAADGVLPLKRGSAQRRGPGGSAVVEWSALLNFIKQRRLA